MTTMTLFEQIKADMKQAMKDKDAETLSTLRLLFSSLKNKTIDLKKELDDAEVVATVKSDIKKLNDALKDFTEAAREDLVEKTKAEITVLKKYMPPEMSDEDLEAKVKEVLEREGIKDIAKIGMAIGAVMKELGAAVDGNRVRQKIEQFLKD
jgi:uncharacterized protein YqeY